MNPFHGEIVINLDKPRTFRLTWNEMAAFEALRQSRTGERTSFVKFLANAENWTLEDMRLLLWVGICHEDKSLTEDALGQLLGLRELNEFQLQFAILCRSALPEDLAKKKEELLAALKPNPESSPGTTS